MRSASKHFVERARERGLTVTDPRKLAEDLKMAWGNPGKYDDYVDVVASNKERVLVRFRVEEGIFYAIQCKQTGVCITFVTQEYIQMTKRHLKGEIIAIDEWIYLTGIGISPSKIRTDRRPKR